MSVRRRRRGHAQAEHVDERWMASYMDMVTVLMCLFIVLYAMSTVDQDKFVKLKLALATGFGTESSLSVDASEGVVVPAEMLAENGSGFMAVESPPPTPSLQELAQKEVDDLEAIREQIRLSLAQKGLEDRVGFVIDSRGLTVRLIGTETFFGGNSAALTADARAVLDSIGPVIRPLPNQIAVEGHADRHGSSGPFPTDWELSASRATGVLRYMVEGGGFPQERISATGFGSARPLSLGETENDYSLNRRVDIVVLSTQSDGVRALIPDIIAHEND